MPWQLTVRRAVHPLLLRLGDRLAELKASVEASTAEVRINLLILHLQLLLLIKLMDLFMRELFTKYNKN